MNLTLGGNASVPEGGRLKIGRAAANSLGL
jgi:hypothetical protein